MFYSKYIRYNCGGTYPRLVLIILEMVTLKLPFKKIPPKIYLLFSDYPTGLYFMRSFNNLSFSQLTNIY